MEFRKYQHIERLGHPEVNGILDGECWVFPKLDGTNASVWVDNEGVICAGSRNRELSIGNDNAGFLDHVINGEINANLCNFFGEFPQAILYGEWLVKHSFKQYDDDAWRKFYVFDVIFFDEGDDPHYVHPLVYMNWLEVYGIEYIPPIAKINNPTEESLHKLLEKATYKVKDGFGPGEGIVIKNYQFVNRYGRVNWAKIVRNEFKAAHSRTMLPEVKSTYPVEQKIVDNFLSRHMIEKVFSNICAEGEWTSKDIPRLLNTVYYDLVRECSWDFVKKYKNPTVDFRRLSNLTTLKIKQEFPELF